MVYRAFELIEFVIAEFDVDGGNGVVDLRDRVGPDDRGRHQRAMVQPRQGERSRGKHCGTRRSSPTASMMARSESAVWSVYSKSATGWTLNGWSSRPRHGRASRPRASGLQTIVPTPSSAHSGSISRSSSRASRL